MNSWGISSSTITFLQCLSVVWHITIMIFYNSHKNGYFKIADKGKGLSLRAEEKLFVISRFKWDRKTFSKVYFYLFFAKLCLTRIWHVVNYVLQGFLMMAISGVVDPTTDIIYVMQTLTLCNCTE